MSDHGNRTPLLIVLNAVLYGMMGVFVTGFTFYHRNEVPALNFVIITFFVFVVMCFISRKLDGGDSQ